MRATIDLHVGNPLLTILVSVEGSH